MTIRPTLFAATAGALLLVASLLTACKNTSLTVACQTDSDCGANFRCESAGQFAGNCVCANNLACPPGDAGPMFCNPQGLCQSQVGCFSNSDCNASGLYCDTSVGLCVTGPACGSDIDCPIGEVCSNQLCVPGCRSNGDCPLGDAGAVIPCVCAGDTECLCPPPDAGVTDPASYDRTLCPIGACNGNTCAGDTSVCPYNDSCVGGGDGGSSTCQRDPRDTVLCQDCSYSPGSNPTGCSGVPGANFCLLDLADPSGATTYCGVDCSEGQGCPSGFECDDVIVLTSAICTSDPSCKPTGGSCHAAATDGGSTGCPIDTVCDAVGTETTGQCGGFCVKAEGEASGFCTCVEDSDCPQAACDPTSLTCPISQTPCALGSTCPISCVDFGGGRGCYIGRNCAPTHGLNCPLPNQQ